MFDIKQRQKHSNNLFVCNFQEENVQNANDLHFNTRDSCVFQQSQVHYLLNKTIIF